MGLVPILTKSRHRQLYKQTICGRIVSINCPTMHCIIAEDGNKNDLIAVRWNIGRGITSASVWHSAATLRTATALLLRRTDQHDLLPNSLYRMASRPMVRAGRSIDWSPMERGMEWVECNDVRLSTVAHWYTDYKHVRRRISWPPTSESTVLKIALTLSRCSRIAILRDICPATIKRSQFINVSSNA